MISSHTYLISPLIFVGFYSILNCNSSIAAIDLLLFTSVDSIIVPSYSGVVNSKKRKADMKQHPVKMKYIVLRGALVMTKAPMRLPITLDRLKKTNNMLEYRPLLALVAHSDMYLPWAGQSRPAPRPHITAPPMIRPTLKLWRVWLSFFYSESSSGKIKAATYVA